MGVDQQAASPCSLAMVRKSAHSGSVWMSLTITDCLVNTAVPHEPAAGPMRSGPIALQ